MDIHSKTALRLCRTLFPALLVTVVAFTGSPLAVAEDVVTFVNGDRLTGKFVEASQEGVTFAGTFTGRVSLQWNAIQKINFSPTALALTSKANAASSMPNKFTASLNGIDIRGTDLALIQSAGPPITVHIVDVVSLMPPSSGSAVPGLHPTSILNRWRGMLQMQDSLTGATQKKYDLAGTLHVARPTESKNAFRHQVTSVDLDADYGEAKKPQTSPVRTVLYEGTLEHEIYLDDKASTYLFGLTDFYHNLSLSMNFRQSYGGGIGWNGHCEKHRFGFAVDLRYIGEDIYAPGVSLKLAASGLSEYYTYTFPWPKKKPITFYERVVFIPAFNQSRAYQARGITRLRLPLTRRFSVGIQEYDDYLRNSPKGTNQNYSKVSLTLNYAIGAPL